MYRIRWLKVLVLGVALGVTVLFVRGCVIARRADPAPDAPVAAASPSPTAAEAIAPEVRLSVYDHRAECPRALALEAYLVGVVAAEMPVSFDKEALKAQAVAARTYTLHRHMGGGCRKNDADVCTNSACCQAYRDDDALRAQWGDAYETNLARVAEAVYATAGQVLLYDGAPIEALYHSASGGMTENSEDVYASAVPYLRAVESTNETGTSRLTGTVTLLEKRFIERVNGRFPAAKLTNGKLETQVKILKTTKSGRVQLVRLGGATATGKEVRMLFGLDSTLFTVRVSGGEVRFDTRGFGHGVGMSQTGANSMGKGGRSYLEILQYYYTGVTLGSLTP